MWTKFIYEAEKLHFRKKLPAGTAHKNCIRKAPNIDIGHPSLFYYGLFIKVPWSIVMQNKRIRREKGWFIKTRKWNYRHVIAAIWISIRRQRMCENLYTTPQQFWNNSEILASVLWNCSCADFIINMIYDKTVQSYFQNGHKESVNIEVSPALRHFYQKCLFVLRTSNNSESEF